MAIFEVTQPMGATHTRYRVELPEADLMEVVEAASSGGYLIGSMLIKGKRPRPIAINPRYVVRIELDPYTRPEAN